MDIKLKELQLSNFKGIRELTVIFDEEKTDIYGSNATGKTTLFDAFCWLLFGKDSQDRTNFEIKTLDKDNNPINRLEHRVKGILSVDGIEKKLEKIYREKWVKKRGEPEPEFSGHETDHFIDLVPVTKKDYESIVNGFISENVFKMITNPFAFSSMKWQDKRNIVIGISGDISAENIAETDAIFNELLDKMEGRKIEDHLKVIANKKREIKDRLSHIPARISELHNSMVAIDEAEILAKMQEIDGKISKTKAEIEKKRSSGSELIARRKELESKLDNLYKEKRAKEMASKDSFCEKILKEMACVEKKMAETTNTLTNAANAEAELDMLRKEEGALLNQRAELLIEYKKWNAAEFTLNEEDSICNTCGQELPDAEDRIKQMKAQFTAKKEGSISEIKNKGNSIKKSIEECAALINEKELSLGKINRESLVSEINGYKDKVDAAKRSLLEVDNNSFQYHGADAEISTIETELSAFGVTDTSREDEVIRGLNIERDAIVKESKQIETNKNTLARIEDVKKEERVISNELALLEKEEYLALQFNKKKMELMYERIKAKFGSVVFKMFNQLINGGEEPTCEIIIDGVPFDNANRAAQINTGISIINTLSSHYDAHAPIFVDNAEAVNELTTTRSQLVRLVVVEPGFKKEGEIILETIK
jgi:DNA repair protein SbcC/Rad50